MTHGSKIVLDTIPTTSLEIWSILRTSRLSETYLFTRVTNLTLHVFVVRPIGNDNLNRVIPLNILMYTRVDRKNNDLAFEKFPFLIGNKHLSEKERVIKCYINNKESFMNLT